MLLDQSGGHNFSGAQEDAQRWLATSCRYEPHAQVGMDEEAVPHPGRAARIDNILLRPEKPLLIVQ